MFVTFSIMVGKKMWKGFSGMENQTKDLMMSVMANDIRRLYT